MTTHSHLSITSLTPEMHERTCNYWYTVTDRSSPHTAFTHAEDLLVWLEERGLKINKPLPEKGTAGCIPVIGTYSEEYHMDEDAFYELPAIREVRELDNGQYTLGRITQEKDGNRTVHVLNPNVKTRPTYTSSSGDEIRNRFHTQPPSMTTPPTKIYRCPYGLVAETIDGKLLYSTMRTFLGSVVTSVSNIESHVNGVMISTPTNARKASDYKGRLTAKKLKEIHEAQTAELQKTLATI